MFSSGKIYSRKLKQKDHKPEEITEILRWQ